MLNRPDQLLFLTDEQLRQGIELLFFAYRDSTSDSMPWRWSFLPANPVFDRRIGATELVFSCVSRVFLDRIGMRPLRGW